MLLEQTKEKLNQMKLFGMAQELTRQMSVPDIAALSFEERISLLIDMEESARENRR